MAGAGIGGLAAALALSSAGCRVTILERGSVLAQAGAGIQLGPNACRVLQDLRALRHLTGAMRPERLMIRRGSDARILSTLPLGEIAEQRWGAPTIVAHRSDVQQALLQAVALAGDAISLVTGAELTGFVEGAASLSAMFRRDGADRQLEFDGLVGADGLNSRIRQQVEPGNVKTYARRTAFRSLIDADAAPAFARSNQTNLWLGSGAHLVHYPVRGGDKINVVAIVADSAEIADAADFWNERGDESVLLARFGHWHPEPRALLLASPGWRKWPLFDRAPLKSFHKGRVVLLGDAAHPMLPFLAQGSAQAIEDAAVLGLAFGGGQGVIAAFAAYSAARTARTAKVQAVSRRQGSLYHFSGPAAFARDFAMSAMRSENLAARMDWLYGYRARL